MTSLVPRIDPIAVQMRAAREAAGLSLTEAGRRCAMSPVVVGSYERGDRQPPLNRLRPWVERLDHHLIVVPKTDQQVRHEYAVRYGTDGLIECATRDEAELLARHIVGGRLVRRLVRVGGWEETPRG